MPTPHDVADAAEKLAEATARTHAELRRSALSADVPAAAVVLAALGLAVEAQQLAGRQLHDLQATVAAMWRDQARRRESAVPGARR